MTAIVVAHFDGHGVCSGALIARKVGASRYVARYPDTGPELLVSTLTGLMSEAPSDAEVYVVDVPVNVKDPQGFVEGLNRAAGGRRLVYVDHHETSAPYLGLIRGEVVFNGPSAYDMVRGFIGEPIDEVLAVVGAICDRDPEVIRRGLWSLEAQLKADGIDIMVRDDAQSTLELLVKDPEGTLNRAASEADRIPTVGDSEVVGRVAIAKGRLPGGWGPKALEKLAYSVDCWYAVGMSYEPRLSQWIVRAIVRWDVEASRGLPKPKEVALRLWPSRPVLGHPSAPTVAASSEDEARSMVRAWAEELAKTVEGA